MASCISAVLLCRRPRTPVANKWTKLGPAVDWYALFVLIRGFGAELFATAFAACPRPQAQGQGHEDEEGFSAQGEWKRLEGKRVTKSLARIGDRDFGFDMIVLMLSIGPIRFITSFFLKCCRERTKAKHYPCMVDLASPATSPVFHVLQYLSCLLTGRSPRLVLIMGADNACFSEVREWCLASTRNAGRLRHAVLVVAAWMHERHHRHFAVEHPFRLACLGDDRVSPDVRRQEASRFRLTRPCCLPHGFARRLHMSAETVDSLVSPVMQRLIYRLFTAYRGTIADIEARHARNQRRCPEGAG